MRQSGAHRRRRHLVEGDAVHRHIADRVPLPEPGQNLPGDRLACQTAGKPMPRRVYPRGCGGASAGLDGDARHQGLSPRVRGSPLRVKDLLVLRGSIPRVRGSQVGHAGHWDKHGSIPAGAGSRRYYGGV